MESAMIKLNAQTKPRVVIVGGGFGGLTAAKGLADAPFEFDPGVIGDTGSSGSSGVIIAER
jgi:glycine/D-amino acid oxidase-like deaminating enzyme